MSGLQNLFRAILAVFLVSGCGPEASTSSLPPAPVRVKVTVPLPPAPRRTDGLQFRYDRKKQRCLSIDGSAGHNQSHLGECGRLEWSDLSGKVVPKISFRGADLRNANLGKADFRQSDFRGADLRGANLFQSAQFQGALYDSSTQFSISEAEVSRLGFVKQTFDETQKNFIDFLSSYSDGPATKERLRLFLEWGVDVNDPAHPPLESSVGLHRIELMKLLLWAGADPNGTADRLRPLHRAVANACQECLPILIAYGANVNGTSPALIHSGGNIRGINPQVTSLMVASLNDDIPMIQALLDLGAEINFEIPYQNLFYPYYQSYTAITAPRDLKTVKYLVSRGASLKFRPFAVEWDNDIAKYLLDNGADINEVIPDGSGLTFFLRRMRPGQMTRDFLKDFDDYLKKGVNVNTRTADGSSALSYALEMGDLNLIRKLLDAGADLQGPFNAGASGMLSEYLYHSVRIRYSNCFQADQKQEISEVVSLLLSKGADPNKTNRNGDNAVLALVRGANGWDCNAIDQEHPHFEAVFANLLRAGSEIEFVSKGDGFSPLTLAASRLDERWIPILLSAGAEIGRINGRGRSAIVELGLRDSYRNNLSRESMLRVLQTLVAAGANLNTVYDGKSLLEIYFTQWVPSVEVWDDKTIFWMISAGANPAVVNANGQNLAMIYLNHRNCILDSAGKPKNPLYEKFVAAAHPNHRDNQGRFLVHYLITKRQTGVSQNHGTRYTQGTSAASFMCFAKPLMGRFDFNAKNSNQEAVFPLLFLHLLNQPMPIFSDPNEEAFAAWIKRLARMGLDVNQTDAQGRTLYQLSLLGQWQQVARALLESGARP